MATLPRAAHLPREVISLKSYAQLDLYLAKHAAGELGLVLLLGRPGTGKSETVRRALTAATHAPTQEDGSKVLYVEGHMQPFGLYQHLWEFRDRPVILDDLDKLYADADCVRLLKPLCNTSPTKRISWLTNVTVKDNGVPASFSTSSSIILIANEWRTINPNVRALEDRAIILHFDPPNTEVHQRVGQWFNDHEVYSFLGDLLHRVNGISMRHYCKGSQLRRAGLLDWQSSLLQMILPDARQACIVGLQRDPGLGSEEQRVERFMIATGCSRATYFRVKAKLPVLTGPQ